MTEMNYFRIFFAKSRGRNIVARAYRNNYFSLMLYILLSSCFEGNKEKTASSTYCVHHKLFNDKSEHVMFD